MGPLLSVIIPFYNGEKYVENIANAFLAQSVNDFELICVDDGSIDGTLKKLDNLKNEHPELNLTIIHQENKGVSAARNKGLENVKGRYISFVDEDDYVSCDYVEILKSNIDKRFDILVFQLKKIKLEDKKVSDVSYDGCERKDSFELLTEFAEYPTLYGSCNMFISKEFFDKYQFKFREGYKYYEDYEFLYRVFVLAENILYTKYQAYFYILNEGSAMQTFKIDRLTCVKILEELRPFVSENVPEFLPTFDTWCISRIYWSIAWQAALSFMYSDFKKFIKLVGIKEKVKPLICVPNKKEKYSTLLLEYCMLLYYFVVNLLGHSKSTIKQSNNFEDFEKVLNESISSRSDL